MKLWEGMLEDALDPLADRYNRSIDVDVRMLLEDMEGSIAHATMLGEQAILESSEAESIVTELRKMQEEVAAGTFPIDFEAEDVHTLVEAELTRRLGDAGKRLHTARSRNDQVATDLRLYLRKRGSEVSRCLSDCLKALLEVSRAHTETILPGMTHLQAAQPVTLAHHLLAYVMAGLRDLERLTNALRRVNRSPLGSGALAGTTYPIDRQRTAQLLHFDEVLQNSMDAVSDRDFVVEISAALSITQAHLSRLAEDLIIWSSQPFGYISMAGAYTTGSSIMPQKKNPDMAELIRGTSGRVFGNLMQSLTMMKGLPMAYGKDLQEDKKSLFESLDLLQDNLTLMGRMIATMQVHEARMLQMAELGYLNATDVADYLVRKGAAFRDAHHIAARLVQTASNAGISLRELPLEAYQAEHPSFEADVYDAIDLKKMVEERTSLGGPAPSETLRQIAWAEERLKDSAST